MPDNNYFKIGEKVGDCMGQMERNLMWINDLFIVGRSR
jgi:hypothetical protein